MLRRVTGVVAGYFVFAVSAFAMFRLSGRDPHQEQDIAFVVLTVLGGMIFALVGGYLAGAISGRSPRTHGGAVAAVIALGATASILAQPSPGSRWSQAAALAFMAPVRLRGGHHQRQKPGDINPGAQEAFETPRCARACVGR